MRRNDPREDLEEAPIRTNIEPLTLGGFQRRKRSNENMIVALPTTLDNASQFPHMKDQGKLLSAYNPMGIHNLSKSDRESASQAIYSNIPMLYH